MNYSELQAVNDEVERYDRLLIAAEGWGKGYKKNLKTHAKLIKIEARMAKDLRVLFKDLGVRLVQKDYIDWGKYFGMVRADFTVEAIIKDEFYDTMNQEFLKVVFDTVTMGVATGAQAGEDIYKIPLGIRSSDEMIQRLATDRLAYLVGKKINKDGQMVDNPKAEYRISDRVRNDINQSIKTSISLGEDKDATTDRLRSIVDNPSRAAKIAQTESVNAYGSGLIGFGKESGATGKEWQTVGAEDVCADNAGMGLIGIDEEFVSGDIAPAAHPGCRCSIRLAYANEYPLND